MPAITINNSSFEFPNQKEGKSSKNTIDDWDTVRGAGKKGGGDVGVYNDETGDITGTTGTHVGFIGGTNQQTSASQTLSETYSSTNEYTFSVDVGDPTYYGSQNYTINLYAGSTRIATQSGSTGDTDSFQTVTLTSDTPNPALNGQALRIEIVRPAGQDNGEYLYFDNVQGEFNLASNGIVDGTSGDDAIGIGYVDVDGDIVDGADGDDDTIEAGAGNDTVEGGAGADSIDGGTGTDELTYTNSASGVEVQLGSGTGVGGDAQGDTNTGFENLTGSAFDDTLTGDSGDNVISGLAGNDTISGNDGNDVFIETAGDGTDTITDFNVGNTGSIDDNDQTNNDFVDLETFYNSDRVFDVNAAGGNFENALGMLRADAADGRIDGNIGGVDYSAQIGDVDLILQDGTGGTVTGTDLTFDNTNVMCFLKETLVSTTSSRSVLIEDLEEHDAVLTHDGTIATIRWIGSRRFDAVDLAANPKLRPVRIRAGALGAGTPEQDLWVSRQHRVLVRSMIAQRMFGTDEVLVPAIMLVGLEGIDVDTDLEDVEYYHILFDKHEVICSNGAWTESLFTGPEALKAVSPEARKEIEAIFPAICEPDFAPEPARHIPQTGKLIKELVGRHTKNNKPLYHA